MPDRLGKVAAPSGFDIQLGGKYRCPQIAEQRKKESPPKPKLDAVSAKWARKALEHRLGEYKTSIGKAH
jgi:hypothetical protein